MWWGGGWGGGSPLALLLIETIGEGEKETATHSSILAWRIPLTEEPCRNSPWGHKESDTTERLSHTHTRVRKKLGLSKNEFSFFLFKCLLCMLPNPRSLRAWHVNSLYSDHH